MTLPLFFPILGLMNRFDEVKLLFSQCRAPEQIYQKIIELGRLLDSLPPEHCTSENLVHGCQSQVYLTAQYLDGKVFFQANSESLISAGLCALLIKAYNGQTPEFIIQSPPTFLEELNINTSLSPGRSNGLASMLTKMQQEALKFLVGSSS